MSGLIDRKIPKPESGLIDRRPTSGLIDRSPHGGTSGPVVMTASGAETTGGNRGPITHTDPHPTNPNVGPDRVTSGYRVPRPDVHTVPFRGGDDGKPGDTTKPTPAPWGDPMAFLGDGTSLQNGPNKPFPAADRTISQNALGLPVPIGYGQCKAGTNILTKPMYSGGRLVMAFGICEGPIDSVISITVDGHDISNHSLPTGAPLGLTLGTDYRVYLGAKDQTVDPALAAVFPGFKTGWPGLAYVVIVFNNPFDYDPTQVVVEFKGKTVVDPRVDLTTRAYSTNCALGLLDLMRNPTYGLGVADSYLDIASGDDTLTWSLSADDCDATLSRPAAPGGAPTFAADSGPTLASPATYYYTYTYVNGSGVESLESAVSAGHVVALNGVNLTIANGPGGTASKNIYRSYQNGSNTSQRHFVGSVNDNTTTTFHDALNDISLGVTPPTQSKRFEMGLFMRDQQTAEEWINTIRAHFQGYMVYNTGKYQLFVDKAKSATSIAFTDTGTSANIIGRPSVRTRSLNEVYTRVVVTYTDISNGYTDATATAELPAVSTRKEQLRQLSINLPGVMTFDQAQRLANLNLNRSLADRTITLIATAEGLQPLPGDIVLVTADLGLSSTPVLVTDCQPSKNGMEWTVTGEFYDASIYSDTIQVNPFQINPFINVSGAPNDICVQGETAPGSPTYGAGFIGALSTKIYWAPSQLYDTPTFFDSTHWTQTNLAAFDGGLVNDGVPTLKAFDSAAGTEGILTFDSLTGFSHQFGRCRITMAAAPGSAQEWLVEYSDNGSSWTKPNQGIVSGSVTGGDYTIEWAVAAGSHRYWRIRKGNTNTETTANYSEVQFFDAVVDPTVTRYDIYNDHSALGLFYTSVAATALPTAANPLDVSPIVFGNLNVWPYSASLNVLVKAVRGTLGTSTGVSKGWSVASSANDAPDATGLTPNRNDVTLVNGANDDVSIQTFVGDTRSFIYFTGPSASYNVTGMVAGPANKFFIARFAISQTLTLKNENAGSTAANRIHTTTGADVAFPAGKEVCAGFIYDGTISRWVMLWGWQVSSGGGGGTTSPLTTKGDIWGYDSTDNRVPVGSNGQVLTADSTQALGIKWAAPATTTVSRVDEFTGDGSTTAFVLGATPAAILVVAVNGMAQKTANWSLSSSTVTFTTAPLVSDDITIYYLTVLQSGTKLQQDFTGDGSTTTFTLSHNPLGGSPGVFIVAVGGEIQKGTSWSIASLNVLTFTTPPTNTSDISIVYVY